MTCTQEASKFEEEKNNLRTINEQLQTQLSSTKKHIAEVRQCRDGLLMCNNNVPPQLQLNLKRLEEDRDLEKAKLLANITSTEEKLVSYFIYIIV